MLPKIPRAAIFLIMAVAPAVAQSSGGTTGPPRAKIPPTLQTPRTQDNRPIFVSGRVVLDDGTKPTVRVAIERVCNNRTRREGYTDTEGTFSFQLGESQQFYQDARMSSAELPSDPISGRSSVMQDISGQAAQINQRDLMLCELRAVLPGYHSDTISLAGRQPLKDPDVGTIVLHRMGKVEGTSISASGLEAPKEAKKAFEEGVKERAKGKPAEATKHFEKALSAYPNYAEAMVQLGELYSARKRGEEAEKMFERAISVDARYVTPYLDLAVMAVQRRDWERVATLTDKALALNAYEYAAAYYYNGMAYFRMGKMEQAEKSARAARRLDTQHRIPNNDLVLASILQARNDDSGVAEELRTFLKYVPTGPDADRVRRQLAETEARMAAATPPAAVQPR